MYSALEVSYFVIKWYKDHNLKLSFLKLQFILLIMQAEYCQTGVRLIRENFCTYPLGVVIPKLQRKYLSHSVTDIEKIKSEGAQYSLTDVIIRSSKINASNSTRLNTMLACISKYDTCTLMSVVCNDPVWVNNVETNGYGEPFSVDEIQKLKIKEK